MLTMELRIDCHVHTAYSSDSGLSLVRLIEACKRKGINGVCITDHNTIAGAQRLTEIASFTVIVGEEISTTAGEIIGYFLIKEIPPGLSPAKAVAAIKEQGGLVAVPHPFDRMRRSALKKEALLDILDTIDIIEVFNSRNLFEADNLEALQFARMHGKVNSVGSDCHTLWEVGNSFVIMNEFNGPGQFLAQLRQGKACGQSSPIYVHCLTKARGILSAILPIQIQGSGSGVSRLFPGIKNLTKQIL